MDALDQKYRLHTLALRAQTLRDLQRLWPMLDLQDLESSFPSWAKVVEALVRRDRQRVATVAAAYLTLARDESGVQGSPTIVAAPLAKEQFNKSLETTAKAGFYTALRYYPPAKAAQVAFVGTAGSMGRLVLNGGRDTVLSSLKADPEATGWQRVTSGSACAFCKLLAGRGAVYSSGTARFSSHDHCACSIRPVYGEAVNVLPFEPSRRNRSAETRAADNQRVRDFIAG